MENRILNIDEIASINNKYWRTEDEIYRKSNPHKDIPREPEPSDEESDIAIIIYEGKKHYCDLDGNIYKIKEDSQIGNIVKTTNQ